jgi:hypothetical protein
MFNAEGYEQLITALYFKGDPYLKSYAFPSFPFRRISDKLPNLSLAKTGTQYSE